jgi:hypothetical protein
MKSVMFTIIFVCGIAAACTKERTCKDDFTTLKYLQTGCADPWQNSFSDSFTIANVTTYLLSQGLFVDSVFIKKDTPAQVCLACNCKTGKTIYVTTLNDSITKAKFTQIGFMP